MCARQGDTLVLWIVRSRGKADKGHRLSTETRKPYAIFRLTALVLLYLTDSLSHVATSNQALTLPFHSFSKFLCTSWFVLGLVLDPVGSMVNQTDSVPQVAYSFVEGAEKLSGV